MVCSRAPNSLNLSSSWIVSLSRESRIRRLSDADGFPPDPLHEAIACAQASCLFVHEVSEHHGPACRWFESSTLTDSAGAAVMLLAPTIMDGAGAMYTSAGAGAANPTSIGVTCSSDGAVATITAGAGIWYSPNGRCNHGGVGATHTSTGAGAVIGTTVGVTHSSNDAVARAFWFWRRNHRRRWSEVLRH